MCVHTYTHTHTCTNTYLEFPLDCVDHSPHRQHIRPTNAPHDVFSASPHTIVVVSHQQWAVRRTAPFVSAFAAKPVSQLLNCRAMEQLEQMDQMEQMERGSYAHVYISKRCRLLTKQDGWRNWGSSEILIRAARFWGTTSFL